MLDPIPGRTPADHAPFVLQLVGYKNSGKTTLTAKLVARLKQAGCRVGTVKHDAHEFDMDRPGTDTWKHQAAGADMTAISSASGSAILSQGPEPLSVLLAHMRHLDVVLVEGFKQAEHPKLILLRTPADEELLRLANPLLAVVWPEAAALKPAIAIPVYDLAEDDAIAQAVFARLPARER
ncbi:molybdopterin-guanine dinucleotide biosynthesis protein B [Paenibacillus sp. GCM10023250]|uniref:molybdopterin-guanine dinucleotide biosynthesis protein B n=1 Tax=Paenibacillus sp. GCM10023250 TaxID=3252648 RepID=UPI003615C15B